MGFNLQYQLRLGAVASLQFHHDRSAKGLARRSGSGRTREPSPPGTGQDEAVGGARHLLLRKCRREQAALAGRVDSAALELICLKYVDGQRLQERLAVLGTEALAKTFATVLNAISKGAATAVIKSIYQNVTHDIDVQAA